VAAQQITVKLEAGLRWWVRPFLRAAPLLVKMGVRPSERFIDWLARRAVYVRRPR
jgi:hypothetical protein